MKKVIALLLAITLLALSQSIFASAESDLAAGWRPITKITDLEKEIIAQASRQSPEWIYKDAKAFRIKHEVVVEILLKDGAIRYYAAGDYKDPATKQEWQEEVIQEWQEALKSYRAADPTGLNRKERVIDIAMEFSKIWYGKLGDELSAGELKKMDNLMFEYLDIINSDPLFAVEILRDGIINTQIIGDRGKRYLYAFEELHLNVIDIIKFYQGFITSNYAAKEDQPTDQEKIEAIEKIKRLLEAQDNKQEIIYWRDDVKKEIRRLDPTFYSILFN